MNVPSLTFLLFAALVAAAYQLCPSTWGRRLILLAANLWFLWSFVDDLAAFIPLAAFLALGYAAVQLRRRETSGASLAALLGALLLAFCWLKRYSFLPGASFLPFAYVTLGLSYMFFRVLHLVIEARAPDMPKLTALSYLNYMLNFTTLVCGPIQRYQDFHRMETAGRLRLTLIVAGQAVERIVIGSFKVLIVSAALWSEHLRALQALAGATPDVAAVDRLIDGLSVALIYPVYLYFNFSGYIDVVIGVAKFLGLELPENFNRPFAAENFIIFWTRWHITLSNWLKTYVYSPLLISLMRRFPDQRLEPYFGVLAFFVTFFLIGAWHGQTSEFMFYGLLLGLGMSGNKLYQIAMARRLGRKQYRTLCARGLYRAAARGLTFCWFAFSLLWFWSDWGQIGALARALGTPTLALLWLLAWLGAALALAALEAAREAILAVRAGGAPAVRSRYVRTVWETALVVVTVTTVVLLNAPAPDIVYKAF